MPDLSYKDLIKPFDELKTITKMKCSQELIEFLDPLICDTQIFQSIENSNLMNSIMLVSPQDKETIDKGLQILRKIKSKLAQSHKYRNKQNFADYSVCMDQVAKLNSEYLEVIPKKNPELIEAMLHEHQLENETQLLKSVFTVSYILRVMLGAYQNLTKVSPYDYVLGSLAVNLEPIDPNSDQANLILHYLNSENVNNHTLTNIIKVSGLRYDKQEDKKFLKTKNHMLLWHGTPAQNILSIIKSGLKIRPIHSMMHGARYGEGIYFSDNFNLSRCFSAASNTQKYILLCEVACGDVAHVLNLNHTGLAKDDNFDSVRVMSQRGHDWDSCLVKDGIMHPIGKHVNYDMPYLAGKKNETYNQYSEFQKHIKGKVKEELKFINKNNQDEAMDSESEVSSEDMIDQPLEDEDSEPEDYVPTAKNQEKLMDLRKDNKDALFPNQVTAVQKQQIKNSPYGLNYSNYQHEYIVYDKALVRVRYIVQLTEKTHGFN